jgi:hypothetical protein
MEGFYREREGEDGYEYRSRESLPCPDFLVRPGVGRE